uniref:Putative nuclease HARBI1 n=1 Tax=Bactrocera dorsalis TaxID=27457 RepID=A0A034WUQ8_BACDO
MKMQIVCDYSLRIRQATIGYKGSVHDAKIFAESAIGRAPGNYFCERQWIAGDSAYPLNRNIITPFRENSNELSQYKRDRFNKYFSKYRVRVENCFGKLKERFSSLKELRFRLSNENNYKSCCRWILACCILHNILQDFNNDDDNSCDGEEIDYPPEIYEQHESRIALAEFVNNRSSQ